MTVDYEALAEKNPDDVYLMRQLMRAAWLLTKSAEGARSPNAASFRDATIQIHDKLAARLPESQMQRFNEMINQLKGTSNERN